jgi:hypothetical protein
VASDPMEAADRRRCTARNRSGGQCGRAPTKGATVCSMHGGWAPQVIAAARTRVAEAQAVRQLQAQGYEPSVNPVEELLSLAAEVTALKDVLRARVANLSDPEWVTSSKLAVEDVRAVVSAYERALDRCERTLTNMLRLDLEARRVHLAERDAELIYRATEAGLEAIGASDQAKSFRGAFAEELRNATR